MPARPAVVAVTRGGAVVARRLATGTAGDLWLSRRVAEAADRTAVVFDLPLRDHIARLRSEYDALIFVMAAGAVVRLLAPTLTDKRTDPAVVVVDEAGRFAVSLLSGHAGGADDLCRRVAAAIGAQPVLTGASAAQGSPALDVLAQRAGWVVENPESLAAVAAALVDGDTVAIHQSAGDRARQAEVEQAGVVFAEPGRWIECGAAAGVIISDSAGDEAPPGLPVVRLRPRTLWVGVGCERGATTATFELALRTAMREAGLSPLSVAGLASIDIKRDEPGLLEFARRLGVGVRWFGASDLAALADRLPNPSRAVLEAVGTPGVAEAAALLASGAERLLVPKQAVRPPDGSAAVTIAVARAGDGAGTGRIVLVGLGPGGLEHMTPAARAALSRAELIVGYEAYVNAARPVLPPTAELVALPIGTERERARIAVTRAAAGAVVAVVSGGDAGVFAMAGPVYQEWAGLPPAQRPEIETVPGITAAQAAAALLGCPLMHDFVCISLSDHLTPRTVIESRVRAAAEADLVTALYNPAAQGRTDLLPAACRILRGHRPACTPVGLVRDAFRPGQSVRLCTLTDVPFEAVDMHVVVVVGNSQTRIEGGRMITPRGYRQE